MKSLLLSVTLFVLVAVLQAQDDFVVQAKDDLPFISEDKNVSGAWYRKARVHDLNITEVKSPKEEFPFVVRALGKGSLEVTTVSMDNGECIQVDFLMEKTEKPGQYSAFWGTFLTYIYELPVMDHYIFYNEYQLSERKVYVGELVGKDPKENYEALEDFKKFAQWKGFPQESIIVPEQREMCVPKDHDELQTLRQHCTNA